MAAEIEEKKGAEQHGVDFFNGFAAVDPAPFVARGERQLQQQRKLTLSGDEENKECQEFITWMRSAKKNAQRKRDQQLVRDVTGVVPRKALDLPEGVSAIMHDFSPGGHGQDDMLYSKNRDVWENLPRGCAMLQITTEKADDSKRELNPFAECSSCLWAVRSNRKFTGHEDDGAADAQLYSIDGPATTHTVFTLKENGQVLHISARRVVLNPAAPEKDQDKCIVLFLGSKKVHLAVRWDGGGAQNKEKFESRVNLYFVKTSSGGGDDDDSGAGVGDRYGLVKEMAFGVYDHLTTSLVEYLADNRLVINCEFLKPSSSGPIDNATLHGLKKPTAYAFSMVFNVWKNVARGAELCIDPIYSLLKFKEWGFAVVEYCVVPLDQSSNVKQRIAGLPDIEGSVVYHVNELGVCRLEKSKAVGYVVVRALREKAKPFLNTRGEYIGLLDDFKATRDTFEDLAVQEVPGTGRNQFTLKGRDLAGALGSELSSFGGRTENPDVAESAASKSPAKKGKGKVTPGNGLDIWVFDASAVKKYIEEHKIPTPPPQDETQPYEMTKTHRTLQVMVRQLKDVYWNRRLETLRKKHLNRIQERVQTRIQQIDHIPMTEAQKKYWTDLGCAFMEWIFQRVVEDHKKWTSAYVFDNYSSIWTEFFIAHDLAKGAKPSF